MIGGRLLAIAYAFPPASPIGTMRTLRLIRHLDAEGWTTTVVSVAAATYPASMPFDPDLQAVVPSGVRVARAPVLRPLARLASSMPGRARRPAGAGAPGDVPSARERRSAAARARALIDELTSIPDRDAGWILPAAATAVAQGWRLRPDVLYSSAPPWSGQVAAWLVARATRLPWVADFRDPWARAPWRDGLSARTRRWLVTLERRVIERADAVLFATDANRDEYARHYGPAIARRFHVVVNGCDPAEFAGLPPPPDDPFVILHAGSLYGARSPLPLFRAVAAAIRDQWVAASRLRLRFVGATPSGAFEAAAAAYGLGGIVEFLPRIPRRGIVREMAAASCLLILQPGTTVSIPGKLYEYLAAGRPILALCEPGEMGDVVTRHQAGLAVPPDDEAAIAAAVRDLATGRFPRLVRVPAHLYDGTRSAAGAAAIIDAVRAAGRHNGRGV